jgi:hypothetical protein
MASESALSFARSDIAVQQNHCFYGNLYSTRMGILGEIPREQMIAKLQGEVAKWNAADSTVKAIPALHYIAVTAQGSPGTANMYRMRMPSNK